MAAAVPFGPEPPPPPAPEGVDSAVAASPLEAIDLDERPPQGALRRLRVVARRVMWRSRRCPAARGGGRSRSGGRARGPSNGTALPKRVGGQCKWRGCGHDALAELWCMFSG